MANVEQAVEILKGAEVLLIEEIGQLEELAKQLDGKRAELKRVRQSIRLLDPTSEPTAVEAGEDSGRSMMSDVSVIRDYLCAEYGFAPERALGPGSETKYARQLAAVALKRMGHSVSAIAAVLNVTGQAIGVMGTHFRKGMTKVRQEELDRVLSLLRG